MPALGWRMRKDVFMRYSLLSSAILGLSVMATSSAKADHYVRDRDYDRTYREERRRDDVYRSERVERLDVRDLPGRVRDRVDDYRHGRPIEFVEYVRGDGESFYRFRIDDRRHGDFYLEIAPNGHLLR